MPRIAGSDRVALDVDVAGVRVDEADEVGVDELEAELVAEVVSVGVGEAR